MKCSRFDKHLTARLNGWDREPVVHGMKTVRRCEQVLLWKLQRHQQSIPFSSCFLSTHSMQVI